MQGLHPSFYLCSDHAVDTKDDETNAPLRISGELVIEEISLGRG